MMVGETHENTGNRDEKMYKGRYVPKPFCKSCHTAYQLTTLSLWVSAFHFILIYYLLSGFLLFIFIYFVWDYVVREVQALFLSPSESLE